MSNLKPCPFCGSGNLVYNSSSGMKTGRFVRCNDCDACGPLAEDDALARAAWNEAPRWDEVMPLPVDVLGVSIKLGDALYSVTDGTRITAESIEFNRNGNWRVRDKLSCSYTYWMPERLTHAKPNSLESIEHDIYHLVMSEYLDDPEADVKAIMERIKKLTKEGE